MSASIARGHPWEEEIFRVFRRLLEKDPSLGVLDIGANLGQYCLYAGLLNRPAIAVEAYKPNLDKLHHSIVRNNLTSRIILVHNAVSDSRRLVTMATYKENKGGTYVSDKEDQSKPVGNQFHVRTILMDDLADLVTFDRAVLKMDIETYEAKAMRRSTRLLDKVKYISQFPWTKTIIMSEKSYPIKTSG